VSREKKKKVGGRKTLKNNKNGSKESKEGHFSPLKSSLISPKHYLIPFPPNMPLD